jgi:hypothetical protein
VPQIPNLRAFWAVYGKRGNHLASALLGECRRRKDGISYTTCRTIPVYPERGGATVKKNDLTLGILVAVLTVVGVTHAQADDRGADFKATLVGEQEVTSSSPFSDPSAGLDTETKGTIKISFNKDLSELEYVLVVRHGVDVLQAHLHCGRPGQNGPVVVFLFPVGGTAALPAPGVDSNGELARGTLTNANVRPSAATCNQPPPTGIERPVNNIASLFFAAKEGLIYANVHTVLHTSGEIRAQLLEVSEDDDVDHRDRGDRH